MNIEILGSLLSLYKNKQSILYYYVSDCTKDIIKNAILYDPDIDELHDNDVIYVINKSNLQIEDIGKLINQTNDTLRLKIKYKYTITIPKDDYYIFFERKKSKKEQRDLFASLLKML